MIGKVAADFKVSAVQGVLSHQMKRFIIDGDKVILNRYDVEQKVETITFEPNEVYAVDIVMSTGEGKPKEIDGRTTVYKRAVEAHYELKMKHSRAVLSDIDRKFPTFPFSVRGLSSDGAGDARVRIGISECFKHELVHPYPVLFEKEGEYVAHIKFTALLVPTGTLRVSGQAVDLKDMKATLELKSDEYKNILKESVKRPGIRKKKRPTKDKDGKEKKGAATKDGNVEKDSSSKKTTKDGVEKDASSTKKSDATTATGGDAKTSAATTPTPATTTSPTPAAPGGPSHA